MTTTGTVTTKYAQDGWDPATRGIGDARFSVLADLTSTGALTTRYLRGDAVDQIFAELSYSGTTFTPNWTLTDRLGSVRDIINNAGTVQDSITYNAFGLITSETNSANRGRYAWSGRELDVETGLQYNRARYYDSNTGRWLSQDPLGFSAGDSNLYRYVHNQPTDATDPSGLLAKLYVFGIEGLFGNIFVPKFLRSDPLRETNIVGKTILSAMQIAGKGNFKYVYIGWGNLIGVGAVNNAMKKITTTEPCSKIVLVGYSWGGQPF